MKGQMARIRSKPRKWTLDLMALKWNANLVLKVQSIERSWSRLATALPLHIGCCLPCHAHDLLERVSVSLAELGPVSAEVCRLSCHAISVGLMGSSEMLVMCLAFCFRRISLWWVWAVRATHMMTERVIWAGWLDGCRS